MATADTVELLTVEDLKTQCIGLWLFHNSIDTIQKGIVRIEINMKRSPKRLPCGWLCGIDELSQSPQGILSPQDILSAQCTGDGQCSECGDMNCLEQIQQL